MKVAAISVVLGSLVACSADSTRADEDIGLATSAASVEDHVDIDRIAMGNGHICALLREGNVRCWGGSRLAYGVCSGTAGRGAFGFDGSGQSIRGLDGVVDIVAAETHTCAVIRDGSVRCWGGDESQFSTGSNSPIEPVPGVRDVVSVGTELGRTCALLGTGEVTCWGVGVAPPGRRLAGLFSVKELSRRDACVRAGEEVSCVPSSLRACVPGARNVSLPTLRGATSTVLSKLGACGVREGRAVCVGLPREDRDQEIRSAPTDLGPAAQVAFLESDVYCLVKPDGGVSCAPQRSPAGDDGVPEFRVPLQPLTGLTDVVSIVPGSLLSGEVEPRSLLIDACALRRDSGIQCFGLRTEGDSLIAKVLPVMYLPRESR